MAGLGNRIKQLRESLKLTQVELAEKLLVSDKTISKWEIGKSEPDVGTLIQLAKIFNVSVEYLMTGNINTNELEGISKIELACREDNIALLNGVKDIKAVDDAGKDIVYYANKYKAKNILKFLNDFEFDEYIKNEGYNKNFAYLVCAVPKGLKGDDNLTLQLINTDRSKLIPKCVELEKEGFHSFKIFRALESYEACKNNYQYLELNVLDKKGYEAIKMHFGLLDDQESGFIKFDFYRFKGAEKEHIDYACFVKPQIALKFIEELDSLDFDKWDTTYWGFPIHNVIYALKKDKIDLSMNVVLKQYISPSKEIYNSFVKSIQKLILNSLDSEWYKFFIFLFNSDDVPYYREGLEIDKSKKIFYEIQKDMEFNHVMFADEDLIHNSSLGRFTDMSGVVFSNTKDNKYNEDAIASLLKKYGARDEEIANFIKDLQNNNIK